MDDERIVAHDNLGRLVTCRLFGNRPRNPRRPFYEKRVAFRDEENAPGDPAAEATGDTFTSKVDLKAIADEVKAAQRRDGRATNPGGQIYVGGEGDVFSGNEDMSGERIAEVSPDTFYAPSRDDEQRSMQDQVNDIAAYVDAGQRYDAIREAGEFGEGAAGYYASELAGGNIVAQHHPGHAPQGIDTVFLDAGGELHAGETKTIGYGNWHQPQTSRTVDGRQMDQAWVADRLSDIDIEATPEDIGEGVGQVHRDLFQADIPGDTFAVYSVAPDGSRADNSPNEIWSLSNIVATADADTADADTADRGETG